MQTTRLTFHTGFPIGEVDDRIFGGFLEHMGRSIYQGVYDPKSEHAGPDGVRNDVATALDQLDFSVVRYPGGNFVSGYHWQDGVGPREQRPTVRELAWKTIEPNQFGTDEFLDLARRLDWIPMLSVNLGTGTPEEAVDWLEYCNGREGTRFADRRVQNGFAEPHDVRLWCLGNEMDGPWQLGHVSAQEYGVLARQTAKMMKDLDANVETVVCGSCGPQMPQYMEWDRIVLETVGRDADYLSMHRYVDNRADDTADFLALGNAIDTQIEETDAVCRAVQAKRRSSRRTYLCFDEWNVWYKTFNREGMNPDSPFPRPLIEEVYNLEDALVVAEFLNSFIRHADCLKIANIAQMVNVIAPILTRGDDLLKQSIFYAFEMFSKRRGGVSLRPSVDGPTYTAATHGRVNAIDCSAIHDSGSLKVFAVHRALEGRGELVVELADRGIAGVESAELLTAADPKASNSFETPDRVRSQPFDEIRVQGGRVHIELPPLSLLAMTLTLD
jgi:alpha-N-arabinofuranosidase